tara:strand:+ start:1383 stop:3491 length:2109 start_codon:yes stop_codon:yes gene_type:complete
MIIKKLTLYNYRAFSGINTFDFETTKNKPLNIFEAKNGHGKTTFYRAIHWCLFGDESNIGGESTGTQIINKSALRSSELYAHSTYFVEIEIEDSNKKIITFKRVEGVQKYKENPSRSKFLKDKKEFIVKYFDHEKGGYQEIDDEYVYKREVEKILPEKISPFCFFDGEYLKRFLDDYKKISSKIEGHLELVTYLDSSKQASKNLQTWLDRLISKSSGDEELVLRLDEYSRNFNLQKDKVDNYNAQILEAKDDLKDKEIEFRQINQEFNKSKETKKLQDELKDIERDISICNRKIDDYESQYFRNTLDNFDSIIMSETMISMEKIILEREKAGNFPRSKVTTETLKQLISENSLIIPAENIKDKDVVAADIKWSKSFSKNTFLKKLEKFNDSVKQAQTGDVVKRATHARGQIALVKTKKYKDLVAINNELDKKLSNEKEKRDKLVELKKNKEKNAIKQTPETFEILLAKRNRASNDVINLKADLDNLNGKLEEATDAKNYYSKERSKTRKIAHKKSTSTNKKEFVKLAKNVLDQANEMILESILVIVNEYFKDFLESMLHSKNEFFGRIDNDFNMIIEDQDKENVLLPENKGLASEGQRNIFAYSYMLAINKAAGLSFPIMIDTPAGRLDSEHKINTYEKLVKTFNSTSHLNQLLLLVQDSEINVEPEFKDIIRKKIIPQNTSTYFKVTKDEKTKNSTAEKVI